MIQNVAKVSEYYTLLDVVSIASVVTLLLLFKKIGNTRSGEGD